MEERSAGAVLFREDDVRLYLLLHYKANHWDFPKGNIEKDEQELDTVRREVKEESGIDDIEFIDSFRRVSEYYYKKNDKLVHKQVAFYLSKTKQKEVILSHEHIGYEWLTYEEALRRLTFENSRNILRDAEEFLNSINRLYIYGMDKRIFEIINNKIDTAISKEGMEEISIIVDSIPHINKEEFVLGLIIGRIYNAFHYQTRRILKRDATKEEFKEFIKLVNDRIDNIKERIKHINNK